jgi:hypothetical protein
MPPPPLRHAAATPPLSRAAAPLRRQIFADAFLRCRRCQPDAAAITGFRETPLLTDCFSCHFEMPPIIAADAEIIFDGR